MNILAEMPTHISAVATVLLRTNIQEGRTREGGGRRGGGGGGGGDGYIYTDIVHLRIDRNLFGFIKETSARQRILISFLVQSLTQ